MPNEIKTISPEEEKTPSHLPVLTVDKDDVLPTEKQDQEAAWHELKNAYITKRILSEWELPIFRIIRSSYPLRSLSCLHKIPEAVTLRKYGSKRSFPL